MHAALRLLRFLRMQVVTAGMFGISLEQSLKASPLQLARCSAVKSWALLGPALASRQIATARAKTAAPKISEKFLTIAVLLTSGLLSWQPLITP